MSDSTTDESLSILNSLVKWKETYELSFELAEISHILLLKLADYCKEQNIPLRKEQGIVSLMKRAGRIFKLIEEINSPSYKPLKLPLQNLRNRDPKELPDPKNPILINSARWTRTKVHTNKMDWIDQRNVVYTNVVCKSTSVYKLRKRE